MDLWPASPICSLHPFPHQLLQVFLDFNSWGGAFFNLFGGNGTSLALTDPTRWRKHSHTWSVSAIFQWRLEGSLAYVCVCVCVCVDPVHRFKHTRHTHDGNVKKKNYTHTHTTKTKRKKKIKSEQKFKTEPKIKTKKKKKCQRLLAGTKRRVEFVRSRRPQNITEWEMSEMRSRVARQSSQRPDHHRVASARRRVRVKLMRGACRALRQEPPNRHCRRRGHSEAAAAALAPLLRRVSAPLDAHYTSIKS